MKKIVLFGSGAYGIRGLQYFKKENIYAFCDNECRENSLKYGVRYITFEELLNIHGSYVLVISMNANNAHEVARQLIRHGVYDFVILNEKMMDMMADQSPDELMLLLNDDLERSRLETWQQMEINRQLESQLDYLKSVSDIRLLRKANGYLSYVQEDTVRVVKKIFEEVKVLEIKPFLIAGSLLGYHRHNGFIPWDDDVDFGLLRHDYMRLLAYGKANFIYLETKASFDKEDDLRVKEALKRHPNEFIMLVSPNCTQICLGPSEIEMRKIDFFAYDFFKSDHDFRHHKKIISECAAKRYTERGNQFFIETQKKEDAACTESNNLYFGLDNMDSYIYERDNWISRDTLLPLRNAFFEGIECFAPNNISEALSLFYSDYELYPRELTCRHLTELHLKLKKEYIYAGIIADCPEIIDDSLEVYHFLRFNSIYCVYAIPEHLKNSPKLYEKVHTKLVDVKVEFICAQDEKMDCLIMDATEIIPMTTAAVIISLKEVKRFSNSELLKLFNKVERGKNA